MSKIELVDSEEAPICPYCNRPITRILKRSKGFWETHVIYLCGLCHKVLSIGRDQGFGY